MWPDAKKNRFFFVLPSTLPLSPPPTGHVSNYNHDLSLSLSSFFRQRLPEPLKARGRGGGESRNYKGRRGEERRKKNGSSLSPHRKNGAPYTTCTRIRKQASQASTLGNPGRFRVEVTERRGDRGKERRGGLTHQLHFLPPEKTKPQIWRQEMEGLIPPPLHAVRIGLLEKGGGNLRDGLLRRGCITHTHTHTHTHKRVRSLSLSLSFETRKGREGGRGITMYACMGC